MIIKRIASILVIIVLLFTISSPITGSIFSYAAYTGSAEDLQTAAVCAYFDLRGGDFVAKQGGKPAAVAVVLRYIKQFYNDPANNTGIHSTSQFLQHVTIDGINSTWGFSIDQTGLTFLNNLCRWLLGKNEFPTLHSGGSWGSGQSSTDNVYDGALYGSSLVYIFDETNVNPVGYLKIYNKLACNQVGSPAGYFGEDFKNLFLGTFPNYDLYNYDSGYQYSTYNITWKDYGTFSDYIIGNGNGVSGGLVNIIGQDSFPAIQGGASNGPPLFADRVNAIRGGCAFFTTTANTDGKVNFGYVSFNYGRNEYYTYGNTRISGAVSAEVDFDTNNFKKSDVTQNQLIPKVENNYYTTNNYNENQFIDQYIDDYFDQRTTIDDDSGEDPGDEPEEPTGGTTPPWNSSNTGQAGTLTPTGSDGYNLNLPDITLPDLNIDWSLNGLTEKFPFSIPFDLLAFFRIVNAEPETPHFSGSIDLAIVDWDIDIDLSDFDNLAALLRNVEFIAFCIGLILITRGIIKG